LSLSHDAEVKDHRHGARLAPLGKDQPMPMADVWVVVPMYNEVTSIASVISELRTVFPHVVCVDDGSADGSAAVARRAGATVVTHAVNLGQGAALQTGFDFVARQEARWVVTFDADGQHLLEDAVRMVEVAAAEDLDVVLASRFLGTANIPPVRRLVLRAAVVYTRWSSKLELTDSHNGLRVLNTRVLDRLKLRQPRMAHASELLELVGRHRLAYREVPVTIRYTDYSRAKSQSNLNSVNILFDLALARLRANS
jgi:polyprenyl-phospho-N-acetylgalactosaminyl synthase